MENEKQRYFELCTIYEELKDVIVDNKIQRNVGKLNGKVITNFR